MKDVSFELALVVSVLRVGTRYYRHALHIIHMYVSVHRYMHTAPFLLFAEHQCIGCATHSHSQNTLQRTAKGELRLVSNTLQHTATRKLHKEAPRTPHTVKDCKLSFTREHIEGTTLQQTTINCNTLKRTATYCNNTLQHIATHCNTLQHTATGEWHQGTRGGHYTCI